MILQIVLLYGLGLLHNITNFLHFLSFLSVFSGDVDAIAVLDVNLCSFGHFL